MNCFKSKACLRMVAIACIMIVSTLAISCSPEGRTQRPRPKPGPLVPLSFSSGAIAHYWFEDGTILISEANKLLIYNPDDNTRTVTATFAADSTFDRVQCITDDMAIVSYALSSETFANYRINWRSPHNYEEVEIPPSFINNYNLLDCERRRARYDSALIKNEDGLVKHYGQIRSGLNGKTAVWAVDVFDSEFSPVSSLDSPLDTKEKPDRRLELATYSSTGQAFHADYDRAKNQYLWYKDPPAFSAKPENWQLDAWIVSSEVTAAVEQPLPAGPWVYEHGFWKTMSCFSCGCACYENVYVQMENGQIYIMVFGKAVDQAHKGLYKLFDSGETVEWIPVATGEGISSAFTLSPDGCKAAIQKEGTPYLVEICE